VVSKSDSQTLVVPEHADYIYLYQVDESEAYYVLRVIELRGVSADGNFVVLDNMGRDILLERKPIKHMGFARAWQAVMQY